MFAQISFLNPAGMQISFQLEYLATATAHQRSYCYLLLPAPMANVTDPLIAQISGSDPQNLMEYITRQKIYDSRYWKEECFGLTVANVLEKAAALQCLGTFPHTACLALLLKLLQLHPEHALMHSAFVAPQHTTNFKYARALGSLYIRLTSRPVEIYTALEPLYADFRKLRVYNNNFAAAAAAAAGSGWSIVTMDEWIHSLLHVPSLKTSTVLGITLPRLATRRNLQDSGYLPTTTTAGPLSRPSEVLSLIPAATAALSPNTTATTTATDNEGDDNDNNDQQPPEIIRRLLELLRYKAHVQHCPAAMVAWNKRFPPNTKTLNVAHVVLPPPPESIATATATATATTTATTATLESQPTPLQPKRKKSKQQQDARNYTNLFKSSKQPTHSMTAVTTANANNAASDTNSEDYYWNAQRAQMGLDKLR
jgi:pre-mRNA-splicing factor 38A